LELFYYFGFGIARLHFQGFKGASLLIFCSMSFGSFAVIPPELTGGLSLTATPIVAVLIIFRALYTIEGRSFLSIAMQ